MTVSQPEFRAALLTPLDPVPEGLRDSAARPAGRRFDVYRNNVAGSLTEAMHTSFPVITKLIGAETMDGLAGLFLRAHPPSSPLMMHYGEAFPDFIAALPQLSHLGYLPDVARLELAIREAYHAADAQPIDPAALAAMPPQDLMETHVTLAPSLRLLRSDWPLYDLWAYNMVDGAPKPQPRAQDVLILRPEFDPQPHALPPGGAACIAALQAGETLGTAIETATQMAPDFDLTPVLTLLLQGQAITYLSKERVTL